MGVESEDSDSEPGCSATAQASPANAPSSVNESAGAPPLIPRPPEQRRMVFSPQRRTLPAEPLDSCSGNDSGGTDGAARTRTSSLKGGASLSIDASTPSSPSKCDGARCASPYSDRMSRARAANRATILSRSPSTARADDL
eukprot:2204619-Pleurochrysis_carterae.AAC.1